MLLKEHVNFSQALHTFKMDQVYSNTRVPTQVNTSQHESDTSQYEWKTSQHESNRSQHESARKKSPRWVNMSHNKSDTSLTQTNLS